MIDLHIHTTASDGDKSPRELIDYAIEKNLTHIAITDHDTIEGLEEAIEYSKNRDICVIPGIEFEAGVSKGQMHILGLFINFRDQELKEKLKRLKEGRKYRNNKFIEEFNKLGFEITLDELNEVSNGDVIGKPHFAKVFLNKGYIKEKDEIFKKYFNQSPFKEIPKMSYTPKEVIESIKSANGIVILAHPYSLKLDKEQLIEKVKELKLYGLDGIECYHSEQTKEQMIEYLNIAKENNLIITKGSDYHGPITKSNIEIGEGMNKNLVNCCDEEEIIQNLLNYKNK